MEQTALSLLLAKQQASFHPVVHFEAARDKLLALDFTENNPALSEEIFNDTQQLGNYINDQLSTSGARYGIGGYGERRTVYSRSRVFDAATTGEEPRRLHLGTDIWGKPHTAVNAPMAAIVHSFAFNNAFGDYGTTIILSHHLGDINFHTLYGHLSLNSIKNMQPGDRINKGDIFAEFGIPSENGHWPPHLHFQVIHNLQGWEGDYPGVCKYSEKDEWLRNCPDPDLVLNMNRFLK